MQVNAQTITQPQSYIRITDLDQRRERWEVENLINKPFLVEVKQKPAFGRWQWEWKEKIKTSEALEKQNYEQDDGVLEMEMRAKKSSKWLKSSPIRD